MINFLNIFEHIGVNLGFFYSWREVCKKFIKIMTVRLDYSKKTSNNLSSNLVIFCDEKFNTNGLKKYLSNSEFSYINDLLKTIDSKKNLFVLDVNSKKKR